MDDDFIGNWCTEESYYDSDMACSCSGLFVSCSGYPVMWKLQMQTWIFLISTESEYISLIQELRKTILIIDIIKEMKALGYNIGTVSPTALCNLFEDNNGSLTLDQYPPMRPRKNYINVNYHHLCAYIYNSTISILPTDSSAGCLDESVGRIDIVDL